ncbi:MAG: ABC transporter permease [candidate division Zixibacteria bacterium]
MLKSYLKIAIRTLLRHRVYTYISIVGLALGLGLSLISMSYMVSELSWEDGHQNHDRIYRVEMRYQNADTVWASARVMAPLGEALLEENIGIEQAAVFRHGREISLKINNETYQAGNLIFARPEFFDVFTVPIKIGDPETSLANPNSVLITDSIAKAYFPDQNPIGKTITLNKEFELQITGILEDLPWNTQLHCDFIASYSTLETSREHLTTWTQGQSDLTYLLLKENADPEYIKGEIQSVFSNNVPKEIAQRFTFSLIPLKDIYFNTYYSGNRGELYPGGEYDMAIIMVCIGLFILVQAIVNFISLSTARAADRMKEVGVRKTFGAARYRLVAQFLGESMLITTAAMIFGIVLYEYFQEFFYSLNPNYFEFANLYRDAGNVMLLVALIIIVGILAGFYPALYLSRFKPISILKDDIRTGPSRSFLRKSLVVFQFTLAIFFITLTVGYYNQANFVSNMELGFDKENVMILRFNGEDDTAEDCALAKNEILAQNDVLAVARSGGVLGTRTWSYRFYTAPERLEEHQIITKRYTVDYDFLSMYGIEVIEGRGFSEDRPDDIGHSVLINQKMKDELGLGNAIGYRLYTDSAEFEVIGVVKDFQGAPIDYTYRSKSVITLNPDSCRVLCVRLPADNISGSITSINETWQKVFGDRPFTYSFHDDNIKSVYSEFNDIIALMGILSIISIGIAALGVFGLMLYTVGHKTKEFAIRKVLGATMSAIVNILAKEFVGLIIIANLIACPLAYLLLDSFMQDYVIRTDFGIGTFASGGFLILLIALLTSGYHVYKAARSNPSDALRYQ